ncbi:MAG: zinc ribbon domain-containing protein [Oscillospiraceae bacterium]|nr:zinc ribbon domain-containing protein [Oscillospiraceae bacterium]
MNCRYCGAPMRDDAVLCTACGKLTPEFERTYRRPDPTVGAARTPNVYRSYSPEVPASPVYRSAKTPDPAKTHNKLSMQPRQLLLLVIGAIVAFGLLSILLGAILPEETTEAYREAIEAEPGAVSDYAALVDAYLDACAENDVSAAHALFAPAVRQELAEEDPYTEYYGMEVESYHVTDVYPHSDADAAGVGFLLDETVDAYTDVEVYVRCADDEDRLLDFELVQIDGTWYLYDIW